MDQAAALINVPLVCGRCCPFVQVEDDSLASDNIPETGYQDETGQMKRPWCPATRLLEHRETQAQEAEAEARCKAQQKSYCNPDDIKTVLREDFPAILVCTHPNLHLKYLYTQLSEEALT